MENHYIQVYHRELRIPSLLLSSAQSYHPQLCSLINDLTRILSLVLEIFQELACYR